MQEICECNGLTKESFANTAPSLQRLELFMSNLGDLNGMRFFPALSSFCAMKLPNLRIISGMDQCLELEDAWFTECALTSALGLEQCIRLKCLHLSGNCLVDLKGISPLTNLEVLWLCENNLTEVCGLEALSALRVLWLASNHIESIDGALTANSRLEELNLARNPISSFRQVNALITLPALSRLSFMDPHFGACPISGLSNYRTHVVHHLPNLMSLDSEAVSDDAKQQARHIYLKKKM